MSTGYQGETTRAKHPAHDCRRSYWWKNVVNWVLSAAGHYTLAKEPRCILSHAHGNDDDHILSKLYHACCCTGPDKRLSATGCVCMRWNDLEPSHYIQTGHKGGCGALGFIGLILHRCCSGMTGGTFRHNISEWRSSYLNEGNVGGIFFIINILLESCIVAVRDVNVFSVIGTAVSK